jgi:hypothetical protein
VDAVVPLEREGHHHAGAGVTLALNERREPARPREDIGVQARGQPRGRLAKRSVAELGGVKKARLEDELGLSGERGLGGASH